MRWQRPQHRRGPISTLCESAPVLQAALDLAKEHAGCTVIVTHHAPHPMSIHSRFVGDRLTAGFVSDLTPLLRGADLWLHGHVHDSFDYSVAGCRVVANPAGYVTSRTRSRNAGVVTLENGRFDPGLVIDLPT